MSKPNTMSQDDLLTKLFPDVGLTIRERLPFPFIIMNQILTISKATLNPEYSAEEIREAVEVLVHLIPNGWKDGIFDKEVKCAHIELREDIRPVFCGHAASVKYCIKHHIPTMKVTRSFNYYQQLQACIDLMDRKGMIGKKEYTEIFSGKPYSGEGESITDTALNEL